MSSAVVCHSFKRGRVIYERPSRRDAQAYADKTKGSQYDPVERQTVIGSLPMVWPERKEADDRH